MSIQYAAVIKKGAVVCSSPPPNPSLNSSLKRLCAQISGGKMHQLDQGNIVIKILSEQNGTNFCCVADSSCNPRNTVTFLEELSRQWVQRYGPAPPPFSENQKQGEFGPVIQSTMSGYNTGTNQKISMIKQNIAQAQETMAKNLEEALRRGEKLEDMEAKAQNLNDHAHEFERNANKLKNRMCWQKWQYYIIGAVIVVVVIVIIIMIACGTDFKC